MTTTSAPSKKVKANDRVKRVNVPGCIGTVKEVKSEVSAATAEAKEKSIMISVVWDNGTNSYLGPNALEVVKE